MLVRIVIRTSDSKKYLHSELAQLHMYSLKDPVSTSYTA